MKKFCEDKGYDYWKFCKLAREGQAEMESKAGRLGKRSDDDDRRSGKDNFDGAPGSSPVAQLNI